MWFEVFFQSYMSQKRSARGKKKVWLAFGCFLQGMARAIRLRAHLYAANRRAKAAKHPQNAFFVRRYHSTGGRALQGNLKEKR